MMSKVYHDIKKYVIRSKKYVKKYFVMPKKDIIMSKKYVITSQSMESIHLDVKRYMS